MHQCARNIRVGGPCQGLILEIHLVELFTEAKNAGRKVNRRWFIRQGKQNLWEVEVEYDHQNDKGNSDSELEDGDTETDEDGDEEEDEDENEDRDEVEDE